ncbi:unnamed protein product [Rotaria sordida]|uniref:Uncharacterized protein n=1 Tax=Rotaria sordida TaxID=392033 RepID=A0A814UZM9_9BILA|nr:unnamed protein product [Rotaria sordida]CAF1184369.1 unnamed protein product [Rotaria sordida]CAF1432204.1 unnamed protein product [Rotaria sordida]CAF1447249.1 unnamed protein product [Rotaria sordida]
MSSTSPSLQNIQRQHREQNSSSGKFHIFLCFAAAILLLFGIFESYKTFGFITRQCQVKSIDLVEDNDAFYPRWLVMVMYKNQTKSGTLYMMLRRCREVKSEITRQQQQQEEILLRSDERQQPIAPPESPSPPYEKVVQPSTER